MRTQDLIACFQDTLRYARQGALGRETARAAASGIVYKEGFTSQRLFAVSEPVVEVVEGTSFAVAKERCSFGRVAVLNFANPHYPGGGVQQGAMAQEECLCRSSNLFHCLSDQRVFDDYYLHNRQNTDYFFSDRVIYTRGVTVFKDDGPVPQLMEPEQWFRVDVITCAAPYIAKRRYTNQAALKALFKGRIRNILEAAIDNEAEVLILGAFGCGAFQNPPELVAAAFREVLQEGRYRMAFRRVVFAIKSTVNSDPNRVCPNLAAFQTAFLGISTELNKRRTGDVADIHGKDDLYLPGGRILSSAGSEAFRRWQKKNPYFGKQFSILGDSISTLEGYNPRGYNLFYQNDTCDRTGVREMKDTWWGKIIDFFGGELLMNDAWSGSWVSRHPGQKEDFPSACSERRTGNLGIGSVKPDVILVYLGINDWANGVPAADDSRGDRKSSFQGAYGVMLENLRINYPDAEIWCATLSETFMSANPSFRFPYDYGGVQLREYNYYIRLTAATRGCRILDLEQDFLPYDSVDGTHPVAAGMDRLAVLMLRRMADAEGAAFMDCVQDQHDYVSKELLASNPTFICRKCGKTHVQPRQETSEPTTRLDNGALRLYLKASGQTVELRQERVFAGRSKDCDLRLNSGYVARYQATFTCRDKQWYLRDNNSKNGTYLNGTRLDPGMEYLLRPNDVISFARMEEVIFQKR